MTRRTGLFRRRSSTGNIKLIYYSYKVRNISLETIRIDDVIGHHRPDHWAEAARIFEAPFGSEYRRTWKVEPRQIICIVAFSQVKTRELCTIETGSVSPLRLSTLLTKEQ